MENVKKTGIRPSSFAKILAERDFIHGKNLLPQIGPPGISKTLTNLGQDNLQHYLFRNDKGELLGFLQYRLTDCSYEKSGIFNLFVDPRCWRQGIGTALLEFALEDRCPIDFSIQVYSHMGYAFLESFSKYYYAKYGWRSRA